MCNCISYNRPDLGGSDKEVILIPPEFIGKSTVCIDSCMVPIILKLWENNILTLGCCCGHNSYFGPPSVVVEKQQTSKVKRIVGNTIKILY